MVQAFTLLRGEGLSQKHSLQINNQSILCISLDFSLSTAWRKAISIAIIFASAQA